ncbi:fe-S cluster assembly factor HCF101, chloroplastic-like [Prunus avium]|uniref:Fe-S cluster assembly factor HCF101, chloroplastic-like n=1 Tax=Prunus avium TaxID=42229 RepID=A0A6P5RLA3_PRUAV|nr:fe-S cluster assembly factor HCF101, chloroplastic-like [Prunus avium]
MQLLHVPSSLCLSFQNVKTHEEAGLPSYEKPLQLSSAIFCSLQQQRPERSKWASRRGSALSSFTAKAASLEDVAGAPAMSKGTAESDVLKALSQIIDPDFGTDIVSCGFVKDLHINEALGEVSFRLELTTPACPIKDMVIDTVTICLSRTHICLIW